MIREKTCKICGKKFKTKVWNKITCSTECHKTNNKNLRKKWYDANHEEALEYYRKNSKYKYKAKTICKICGKVIDNKEIVCKQRSTTQMHAECVFNDCINTLKSGRRLNSVQTQRLSARGYTISEFREEYL